MSDTAHVERLARRFTLGAWGLGAIVGVGGALEVAPEHRLISATGGLAITLLLSSLACSPSAAFVPQSRVAVAVALRRARRWLGLSAALAACTHATFGAYGYLGSIDLGPILGVPWLRHGALALIILGALSLTSFQRLTRALHVRAWSALHRFAYAAGVLAALHAIGTPFGDVGAGAFALGLVALLLVARPLSRAFGPRRAATPPTAD